MEAISFFEYLQVEGARLFTSVCLPSGEGKYPVVICRSPYVDYAENLSEEEIAAQLLKENQGWIQRGYAVVNQHCRGRGKSTGDCIPYVFERADGLALHRWIREQSFYSGELYLVGGSYTASVHYLCAPFEKDIKGAVLEVQDSERYNLNYRNGFFKIGLHGEWYIDMYKKKSILNKSFKTEDYHMLPLCSLSKKSLGECALEFDEVLRHPKREDPFWETDAGGAQSRDAIKNAKIPVLLTTGFYDIYTGGIFDMWASLDKETKDMSALVVHPYAHGGNSYNQPVAFENGSISEQFGTFWMIDWLDYARGKGNAPFQLGKVTYYELFGRGWRADSLDTPVEALTFTLGSGERTYQYDPQSVATFKGGLSANFGGNAYQDAPYSRKDILTFYTPEFEKDTVVNGKMRATLTVSSDCEDTCFYMRISLCKREGDYGLRDDITQISNFEQGYKPGKRVELNFSFDEHAFVLQKGERLRIDVSSSAYPHYVRHTNNKGLFSEQITTRVAQNTVFCSQSSLTVPVFY